MCRNETLRVAHVPWVSVVVFNKLDVLRQAPLG